jgi:hypothetical protein
MLRMLRMLRMLAIPKKKTNNFKNINVPYIKIDSIPLSSK